MYIYYSLKMVSAIQIGIISISTTVLIGFLGMSTDFLIARMENTLIACQHDTVSINGRCDCSDAGIFDGKYCETCMCEHNGVCTITSAGSSSSRWGCYCPSHQKWIGVRCELCFAEENGDECRGACVDDYYGASCSTYCSANRSSLSAECLEILAAGGVCNDCNGHGECQGDGTCKCYQGWFTNRFGESCAVSCTIDCGANGQCVSVGGIIQCVCAPGYFGESCEIACPGVEVYGRSCAGNGDCLFDGTETSCDCGTFFRGDACDIRCPGDVVPCNDRGICNEIGTCECRGGWQGKGCNCMASYTCNSHGKCLTDGSCECTGNWTGASCERCKDNHYGSNCQLYCNDLLEYKGEDGMHGCWGRGTCQLINQLGVEEVTCSCNGNFDTQTHCETCLINYYPDPTVLGRTIDACSTECTAEKTCYGNGYCNVNYTGVNYKCLCDHPNKDPAEDCERCKEHWFPEDLTSDNACSNYCLLYTSPSPRD